MGPIYKALGLGVGFITQDSDDHDRRRSYRRDVTYLTAKQAGFDYLRDELQYDRSALLHARLRVAIVDEADFVLIDEARTPLVLASEQPDPGPDPVAADRIARRLERDEHYIVDRAGRRCGLTLAGWDEVDRSLGIDPSDEETMRLGRASVHVALHAHHLLARGVDYIVSDGRIRLIDETTGRIAEHRRWPHGIQRALEVKEAVAPRIEGRVRGTITIRDLVQLYARRSGMAEIDEMWAAHLELVEDVREGIHLQRLGHQDPLLVYIRTMSDAFEKAWSDVESRTARNFAELSGNPDDTPAVDDALRAPATTWTYVTSDDPFPVFRVSLVRFAAAPFAWLTRRR